VKLSCLSVESVRKSCHSILYCRFDGPNVLKCVWESVDSHLCWWWEEIKPKYRLGKLLSQATRWKQKGNWYLVMNHHGVNHSLCFLQSQYNSSDMTPEYPLDIDGFHHQIRCNVDLVAKSVIRIGIHSGQCYFIGSSPCQHINHSCSNRNRNHPNLDKIESLERWVSDLPSWWMPIPLVEDHSLSFYILLKRDCCLGVCQQLQDDPSYVHIEIWWLQCIAFQQRQHNE